MKLSQTPVTPVTPIHCVECGRPWHDGGERWRLKVLDEEPVDTVPYCPDCHAREFGDGG